MSVWEQEPCLVEFLEEVARPSGDVGPVRPQLRFSGSGSPCSAAVGDCREIRSRTFAF